MICQFKLKIRGFEEPYKTRPGNKKRIEIEGARFKRVAEPPQDEPCRILLYSVTRLIQNICIFPETANKLH